LQRVRHRTRLLGALLRSTQLRLHVLASGDVTYRSRYQNPGPGFDRAQADLDRKLRAILAQPVQLQPQSHRSYVRITGKITCPVPGMLRAKARRHQDLYLLSGQLVMPIAEHLFALRIGVDDPPLPIHDQHGIGSGI